jgi:prepilin-type N-terminal cleavage/methylation domain-containing protein
MNKGFTLFETLVAMSIGVVLLLAVGQFARDIFYDNSAQSGLFSTAQDARTIVNTMVKELRSASPGSDGSYPIVTAATSTMTFFSDINGDGTKERVRYFLATTTPPTLKKGVITPTGSPLGYTGAEVITTLAYNVRNTGSTSIFNYYDGTFTGTSSPLTQPVSVSAVRLVQINLILDSDPNRSPNPRTYTSDATLRNLKDNL